MELSLRATTSAKIEGDGANVLLGKTFADIACCYRATTS